MKRLELTKDFDRIVVLEGNGESHPDYRFATRAIEFLEEYKDKPFLLMVGFTKPHSPPSAPRKMIEIYDAAQMPLPVDFAPRPTVPAGFPRLSVPPHNGTYSSGAMRPERKREKDTGVLRLDNPTDANVGRAGCARTARPRARR